MKWSPEPWFERSDAPINLTAANYDRARECVNALAGVADPAEDRAAKVELLETLKEARSWIVDDAELAIKGNYATDVWRSNHKILLLRVRAAIARAEKK